MGRTWGEIVTDDHREPGARLRGEPAAAFHAFCHLRDRPPHQRSLMRAYRDHKTRCEHQPAPTRLSSRWELWSSTYSWQARLDEWDRQIDAEDRQKLLDARKAAIERHLRTIQAAIQVVVLPIRIVLEIVATPDGMERLRALGEKNLLGLVREAHNGLRNLPALVESERLALGIIDVERVEIALEREVIVDDFAHKLAADPHAVDLAIALLDRIAGGDAELPPKAVH